MTNKNLMNPEGKIMAELLEAAAQQVDINPSFKNELEKKLMNAHEPKAGIGLFSVKKIASTIVWTVGLAALTLLFILVIRAIAPQPQPAIGDAPFPIAKTATPESLVPINITPENETYNWNGQTLYLNASLPETPAEMKVYLAKDEIRATVEDVKALAEKFGMNVEIYQVAGESGDTTDYLAVDGNQQLRMRSDQYFTYFPNYAGMALAGNFSAPPNAETLIQEFMQAHEFNFKYKIEPSQLYGAYFVLPLTPDDFALHYEQFKSSGMLFYFNQNKIQFVDIGLLKYDETATVSIISAEEAFQKLLDPVAGNSAGILMGMVYNGQSDQPEVTAWRRTFPLNQTITYFGYMDSTGKSVTGGTPLVTLDGYTVTGNMEGVTENMKNVFVKVTGQLHEVDGFKTFEFQSWEIYDGYDEGLAGTIQREGEQVVINTSEGKRLILPDMPSNVPLPLENAYIMGVTQGDTFEWKSFDMRMASGGGGGGGGGLGFYKLNLSGTPVQFPTPTPAPSISAGVGDYIVQEGDTLTKIAQEHGVTVEELIQANGLNDQAIFVGQQLVISNNEAEPQVFEGLRGIVSISIYKQADGGRREEYGFVTKTSESAVYSVLLEGDNLQELLKYQNRPIDIWGAVDHMDQYGRTIINVERYEIPYPDLKIEIFQGIQENITINGTTVTMFTTTDGKKYVLLSPSGDLDVTTVDPEKPLLYLEALEIPGDQFEGYPTLRYFNGGLAVDSITGKTAEMPITADQPYVMDEPTPQENYTPPTITIEKVELIYYIPDPRYITSELVIDQRYLQPAWRFYGHYSDGSEFEYLIQALKNEFLLPELAPYTQPG